MTPPQAFQHHAGLTATWYGIFLAAYLPELVMARRLASAADAAKLDRGSKAVVVTTAGVAIGVGFVVAELFPAWSFGGHWRAAFYAGMVIWIGGVALRWYSVYVLGQFFTFDVAVSQGQYVVESGPYRWVRHPSYAGALVGYLGLGLTLTNWAALLVPALLMAAAYGYRIPVEERALSEGLGAPYREYMRRTWRLVPFVF